MTVDLNILVQHFSRQGDVILLESQCSEHSWSRTSYLAASPKAAITARDQRITITEAGNETHRKGNPWEALKEFRDRHSRWLFGYLGYDLKNHIEKLSSKNPDPVQAPDMYFMNPGFLMEFDHKTGIKKMLAGKLPDETELSHTARDFDDNFSLGNVNCQTSRKQYLELIREAQCRIAEGDFYEINLSHQLNGEFRGSSLALYRRMKQIGPVPFGAYLKLGDLAVCCQSPERFLRKEGSTVFSQPIKGTTARSSRSSEDEALREGLLSSEKERAENLMIVDLVRNDLSRIARRGSVQVPELFAIQSFGTVHQMVSTVQAEAEEQDPIRIFKACFPMGSMTGAPKISAMQSIEELEPYRRGIYSGAIGYLAPNGDFDFNVVIRSAIIRNQNLYYSVGGAITTDSDPHKEWDETRIKARALLDVLVGAK